MKRKKLYILTKQTPDLWTLDTTNLKFAERLNRYKRFSIGATYHDHNGDHHQFIFYVHPITGGIADAKERLKVLFRLGWINIKDYE